VNLDFFFFTLHIISAALSRYYKVFRRGGIPAYILRSKLLPADYDYPSGNDEIRQLGWLISDLK